MNSSPYTHIIWDWNGTLLDDVDWSVTVVNVMLSRRGLRPLSGLAEYQSVFCFPIIKYYHNVGFDMEAETFEELAQEYITLYHARTDWALHQDAQHVLVCLSKLGMTQIILSASQQENLLFQTSNFPIAHFFDQIIGISDIYAKSKVDVGIDYIDRIAPLKALLIGDTTHDYEVAQALGIDCLLVASGHQSKNQLQSCGIPVVDRLDDALAYIRRPGL